MDNAAIDDGLTVAWFTVETLGQLVIRHRADNTVSKAVKRVLKDALVVVDDIGLLPVPAEAAEALFRVIDAAYERRSVAISSNIPPRHVRPAAPGHDRHRRGRSVHASRTLVVTEGDSYRFAQARDGKG